MAKPRIVIKGHKELIRKLKALGSTRVASRILRKVTTAATKPLLQAVKEGTPVDHGTLKKAMASKVKARNYRSFGIVGTDVGKKADDGKPIAGHLSLVNNGFEHVGGKVIPGKHMLEKGFENSKDQCAKIFADRLAEEIEKEAQKA